MQAHPAVSGFRLHHLGMVVDSIERRARGIAASICGRWDGNTTADPIQGVRVTFVAQPCEDQPLIELVEPAGSTSRVSAFLARGGGLHHVCYEVDSIDEALAASRARGDRIVQHPVPAVAFGGHRIAWLFTRDNLLIEYLERRSPAERP